MIGVETQEFIQGRIDELQLERNTTDHNRELALSKIDEYQNDILWLEGKVQRYGIEISVLEKEIAYMKGLLTE